MSNSIEEILWQYIGAAGSDYTADDRRREVEEALKAIEAHITKMVEQAARLAWRESGEGWNSEYTGVGYNVEDEVAKSVLKQLNTSKER